MLLTLQQESIKIKNKLKVFRFYTLRNPTGGFFIVIGRCFNMDHCPFLNQIFFGNETKVSENGTKEVDFDNRIAELCILNQ